MTSRKKPETPEELLLDIESHPERGKINGKEVICFGRREIRGTVSAEAKQKFLRVLATQGLTMNEGLAFALSLLWDLQREAVEANEREKSEKFGVTIQEIQSKVFGAYKARGRNKKANLDSESNPET